MKKSIYSIMHNGTEMKNRRLTKKEIDVFQILCEHYEENQIIGYANFNNIEYYGVYTRREFLASVAALKFKKVIKVKTPPFSSLYTMCELYDKNVKVSQFLKSKFLYYHDEENNTCM